MHGARIYFDIYHIGTTIGYDTRFYTQREEIATFAVPTATVDLSTVC